MFVFIMCFFPPQNYFNCEMAFVNFGGRTLAKEVKELGNGGGESE
jgi:hypothetical protein